MLVIHVPGDRKHISKEVNVSHVVFVAFDYVNLEEESSERDLREILTVTQMTLHPLGFGSGK